MKMFRNALLGVTASAALAVTVVGAEAGGDRRGSIKDGPVPYDSWSGFYVGINAGGAWGDSNWRFGDTGGGAAFQSADADISGGVFGAHAGYNIQLGKFVIGPEISFLGGKIDGGTACPGFVAGTDCYRSVDSVWLFNGRVGYALAPRSLLYVSGGYATGEIKTETRPPAPFITTTAEDRHHGWNLGAGFEYKLSSNFVLGVEWLHVALDDKAHTQRFVTTGANANLPLTVDADFDVIRARLSYKFGP